EFEIRAWRIDFEQIRLVGMRPDRHGGIAERRPSIDAVQVAETLDRRHRMGLVESEPVAVRRAAGGAGGQCEHHRSERNKQTFHGGLPAGTLACVPDDAPARNGRMRPRTPRSAAIRLASRASSPYHRASFTAVTRLVTRP